MSEQELANIFGHYVSMSEANSVSVFLTIYRTDKERFYMSMILALQRNNELYKHIHINYYCCTYVPSTNLAFTKTCVLTISILTLWLTSLLLLCGDVHLNPGPGSVGTSTDRYR